MAVVTSLAGELLRLRCIEAVIEEGERFGVLAREVYAGLTPAPGLDAPVPGRRRGQLPWAGGRQPPARRLDRVRGAGP